MLVATHLYRDIPNSVKSSSIPLCWISDRISACDEWETSASFEMSITYLIGNKLEIFMIHVSFQISSLQFLGILCRSFVDNILVTMEIPNSIEPTELLYRDIDFIYQFRVWIFSFEHFYCHFTLYYQSQKKCKQT